MGGASGREHRVVTLTTAGRRAKAPPTFKESACANSEALEGRQRFGQHALPSPKRVSLKLLDPLSEEQKCGRNTTQQNSQKEYRDRG